MIHIIGDSHCRSFAYNSNFFPIFLGEGKLFNFIDDSNANRVLEKVYGCLEKIQSIETVLFVFGEPDTRWYLGYGWQPWKEDIGEVKPATVDLQASAVRYSNFLKSISQRFPKVSFHALSVCPSDRLKQNLLVEELNDLISQSISAIPNVSYVSVFDTIIDPESKKVLDEFYGDPVHLSNSVQRPVEDYFIREKLLQVSGFDHEHSWSMRGAMSDFKLNDRFGCYMMNDLEKKPIDKLRFTIDLKKEPFSHEKILEIVEEYGLVILEAFIEADHLVRYNKTFDEIIEGRLKGEYILDRGNETVNLMVLEQGTYELHDSVKHLFDTFETEGFRALARSFFQGEDHNFNKKLFLTQDLVGSAHAAQDLHFDVVPTLKFFLYLSDTSVENGAFTVVPTSHLKTVDIREKYKGEISYENRHLSRPNADPKLEVPIEAKGGALIVFSTELFHKAGVVSQGERRVIRSHSWQTRESDGDDADTRSITSKISRLLKKIIK
jgi:ectoine hydroxylase-related dioxygenase (phytanoyl-CoA dioxygenase family)